jgi:hypothetical protein
VGKKKTNTKHELAVKKITEYVISSYFYYKVCEGCESVILEHRVFCPLCDSYNFDYSFKRINERVVELAAVNHEAFTMFIDYFGE